jgi:hypothetical protein
MTDRIAVPERVSQRAKTARRSGGSGGSQTVGDYVGQPAGEAAQAVRRAGLRPGLDRSFGCPAELIGLVVAQDPAAGGVLARNGMVTLYVAAPGGEPQNGDGAPATSGELDETLAASEAIEQEPSSPSPLRPQRRASGDARRSPIPVQAPVEPPPLPAAVEQAAPIDSFAPAGGTPPPPVSLPEIDAPEGALEDEFADDDPGEGEFPHEDFVVHVEDVLAGRSGPPGWRRAYPTRRGALYGLGHAGCGRAWVREHRMLAGVCGLALAVWMVVGLASALDGHHARTLPASAVAPKRAPGAWRHDPAPKPARKLSARKTTARSPRFRPARRAPRAARPRRTRTAHRSLRAGVPAVREALAPAARQAPAPPPPSEAPAPPASTAPEQSGGGLFSP